MGLDGLLRTRADVLSGILNGIDGAVWNPAADPHLPPLRPAHLAAPAAQQGGAQARLGLDRRPAGAAFRRGQPAVLAEGPRRAARGRSGARRGRRATGAARLRRAGAGARLRDGRGRALRAGSAAFFGYDEALAHLIQAGGDALLVPSRFEPCGLTQLCALRYGSVPVVARVGGLADTVIDANEMAVAAGVATGIQFGPVTVAGVEAAIGRAQELWADPKAWRRLQANGMRTEVGWSRPAKRYAQLYRSVAAEGGASVALSA